MSRKVLVILFLFPVFLLSLMHCASASGFEWKTYTNARFGYSLEYPTILVPQSEATNCDGRHFISSDSKKNLLAFGNYNALLLTIEQLYKKTLDEYSDEGKRVGYKAQEKNWFVISGFDGDKVFYRKTVRHKINDDSEIDATVIFSYPSAEKALFDKVTEQIAGSLRF